jgi:hypothetical protein
MIRRWLPFIAGAGIVIWVTALVMLALTSEGPQRFGELYLAILLINVAGVVALLILIGGRLADFIRDWRRHVPGSRLRGRTLLMFGGLAIAPLLLVFTFSVMFLTRGIDGWFHAEVRQGLTDALGLSRAALDLRMREYLGRTLDMADRLSPESGAGLYFALDGELRRSDAEELIVMSVGGQTLAYTRAGIQHALPVAPPPELLLQLRQGRPHVSLQPAPGGGYQVLAATFGVAAAILIESSLAFLGVGDLSVASWGETLNTGRTERKLWLVLVPGFAIFFVVSVFNLVGEGLRDALDPKLKS